MKKILASFILILCGLLSLFGGLATNCAPTTSSYSSDESNLKANASFIAGLSSDLHAITPPSGRILPDKLRNKRRVAQSESETSSTNKADLFAFVWLVMFYEFFLRAHSKTRVFSIGQILYPPVSSYRRTFALLI